MNDELNKKFAITGHVSFEKGAGGLTKAILRSGADSSAELYLFGATLTSWCVPEFGELLFLSPTADLTGASAIRGGVPLVFPQFSKGDNALPSHGFARISHWSVLATTVSDEGDVSISLGLSDSESSRAVWPHAFAVELSVVLGKTLCMKFRCTNKGDRAFQFHMAYHTYFRIDDISSSSISGLQGVRYLDSANHRVESTQEESALRISREIDRIYQQAPDFVSINSLARSLSIRVHKERLSDIVVWNPWIDRSRAIADLEDNAYRSFVCVETGTVVNPTTIAPHDSCEAVQILSYERVSEV
jgi:glucose-6-phosphate 1-epimerase